MSANGFNEQALRYLFAHAIEPEVAAEVGVRQVGNELHFPCSSNGTSYVRRRPLGSDKTLQPKGQELDVWWPCRRPGRASSVLICEGESDALAALSAIPGEARNAAAVVAIPGTGFPPERLAEELHAVGVKKAYLAFDADEAGYICTDKAAISLGEQGVEAFVIELPEGRDLADCLAAEEDGTSWLLAAINGAEAFGRAEPVREDAAPAPRSADADDWPRPPEPAAFYGLAGDVVRTIEPHTEADPAALLIQVLVAFGNAIGRGPGARAEADFHGTNLFVVAVGATSKGRKGASWGQASRPVIKGMDEAWGADRIQGGLSSGEGLIWAVRDEITKQVPIKEEGQVVGHREEAVDPGVEDKRLLAYEPEFASVLKLAGREGNILSAVVRQAWDSGRLRTLTKNSPAKATDAHISIVSHITRDELRRHLDGTEIANGFANRFLWVCVKRSKVLPDGGRLNDDDLEPLVKRLREAGQFAGSVQIMRRTKAASALWHRVYENLSEGPPGLLGAVTSRAEAQVARLACIYALLDHSSEVDLPHLEAALALWHYCEASCRHIFGEALGDPVADTILRSLRGSEGGLERTQLHRLFGRHKTASEMDRALGLLLERGLVRCVREQSGGRPSERWEAL